MILQRFEDFMAERGTSDIPLLMFASDTFTPYWSGSDHDAATRNVVDLIQNAARTAVEQMMSLSSSYWSLDSRPQRRRESWDVFVSALPLHTPCQIFFHLRAVVVQIAGTTDDKRMFSHLLEAVYALIYENKYRKEIGLTADALTHLQRAYELADIKDDTLDDLLSPWLESRSPWDLRLKDYLLDEPEALWRALNDSQREKTLLPQFFEILWKESGSTRAYHAVITKLQKLFDLISPAMATAPFPALPAHDRYPDMPQPAVSLP